MSTQRHGFTKIELVVVIVFVIIVGTLYLQTCNDSRRPARRTMCKGNLKYIGLALHSYHETFKTFPPGWVSSNQFAWSAMILPNLDQGPIFNTLNFNRPWSADTTHPTEKFSGFLCPSDPHGVHRSVLPW